MGQEHTLLILAQFFLINPFSSVLFKAMFAWPLDVHEVQLGERHDIFTSQAVKAIAPVLLPFTQYLGPIRTQHPAFGLFNLSVEPKASF